MIIEDMATIVELVIVSDLSDSRGSSDSPGLLTVEVTVEGLGTDEDPATAEDLVT